MTVGELIAMLRHYPDDMPVEMCTGGNWFGHRTSEVGDVTVESRPSGNECVVIERSMCGL